MAGVLDVPEVDVALAAGAQVQAMLGEPLEEGCGVLDLVACVLAAGGGERAGVRVPAELGQDLPGGEAAHDLGMLGVADRGEVAHEPPLEEADLLVDCRQDPAGHKQFAQVGGGPPGLQGVERLVCQLDLPSAELPHQVLG
ncbi:hypothetical protein ACQEVM_37325 [Streptomyces sp. CA-243310]|uniref:hypothetical protein n=1 Tax=Streptomyces sp. CA-243310 TaxID=3240056 RepID=UPI003D8B3113